VPVTYPVPVNASPQLSDEYEAGLQPPCRKLRADAERNRALIVAAASAVFAEHGLEAPLEEIAARAGVGIATLYRRFPAREQLVAAALLDKVTMYADAADQALADPDPRASFVSFVTHICELQAGDRGLADLLSMTLPADHQVELVRARANESAVRLIDRAKAAGVLRADFVGEDLLLLLIASAAVAQATSREAPCAWRRFVALALDGFRATGAPHLPDPPSTAQMADAMLRLAKDRGCGKGVQSDPDRTGRP
jgi:AcrR family transcriptional regulator